MNNDISIRNSVISLKANSILCREGDLDTDLYIVQEGELLICSRAGSRVTALAKLKEGDYFGEMSFFDENPRSADVISVTDTKLIRIHSTNLKDQLPTWLLISVNEMISKLRTLDQVIREKGIKRQNTNTLKPLSIEEQRAYLEILSKQD